MVDPPLSIVVKESDSYSIVLSLRVIYKPKDNTLPASMLQLLFVLWRDYILSAYFQMHTPAGMQRTGRNTISFIKGAFTREQTHT